MGLRGEREEVREQREMERRYSGAVDGKLHNHSTTAS